MQFIYIVIDGIILTLTDYEI